MGEFVHIKPRLVIHFITYRNAVGLQCFGWVNVEYCVLVIVGTSVFLLRYVRAFKFQIFSAVSKFHVLQMIIIRDCSTKMSFLEKCAIQLIASLWSYC